ncbi:MAG: prolipoprotein diacylglyceryl transferase [Actinomycetota bacterium]
MLASIPSPSSGSLHLGPLTLNAYGAMIALGVIVAVWVGGRRLEARNAGTRDDMSAIAMWGVPAGVIGARIYHVVTDWDRFSGDLGATIQIWKGGLGIWGGIFLGTIVGVAVARRRGLSASSVLTAVAPGLAFAQAIGRWGNWFNQELFGRATSLPWALSVSDDTAVRAGFEPGTTFHPTFLYESLLCAALGFGLIALDRRVPMKPGRLFAFYVAGYTAFRFFIEGLRIDPAHYAGGLRLNQWVSLVVFACAAVVIVAMKGVPATNEQAAPEQAE